MVRLNRRLLLALDLVSPHNCQPDVLRWLDGVDRHGMGLMEVAGYLHELEALGMAEVVPNDDGSDYTVILASTAVEYRRERVADHLRTVGRAAFQLLMGASGGAVVWLLTRLAEG